jgi:hypothetical protein
MKLLKGGVKMAKAKYKVGTKWNCDNNAETYEILYIPESDSNYQEYLVKTTKYFSKGFKNELITDGLLDTCLKVEKEDLKQFTKGI